MALKIDSREKLPYQLSAFQSEHVLFDIKTTALKTGDYAISLAHDDPPEATAIIERKEFGDLLNSLTHQRARFDREMERMADYGWAGIVAETDVDDIVLRSTRVTPASVMGSLVAFSMRHGVHVWFAGNRSYGERLTWKLCERWARERLAAQGAML